MLDWGGYVLLALATVLGRRAGDGPVRSRPGGSTTLVIAAAAAAWMYVGYTRRPLPRRGPSPPA